MTRRSPEEEAWYSMVQRCTNPKKSNYRWYGARGIRVCDRWLSSKATFLVDVGPRPSPLHSLDRIDNDGNYEPGNCRWATREEQRLNQRPRARKPKPPGAPKVRPQRQPRAKPPKYNAAGFSRYEQAKLDSGEWKMVRVPGKVFVSEKRDR